MNAHYLGTGRMAAGVVLLGLAGWISGLPALGKEPAKSATPPTFTKEVSRLLQKNCQECHRKGEVAPFPLMTYEQARKRAKDIAYVAGERSMPPWKPEHGVAPKFKNDRALAPEDIAVFEAWADAGAPKGDPKDMPPPAKFAQGWTLGKPDLVLEMAEEFTIPSSGPDIYRCFVIPTNLPRDMYIEAVEFLPGNHQVVHHIVTYFETNGEARKLDAAEPGPGYISFSGAGVEISGDIGGWTPGNQPTRLPEGIARPLPKGADIILQVHYHPIGKTQHDRSRIGLHFAKMPVKQSLHWANATCENIQIPAGNPSYEVKATWYVPVDVEALGVTPHMHMLGHDFRMNVTLPGGRVRDLIHIADWDPDWQDTYYFTEPISLPRGSMVNVIARYDNTDHPRNPNRPPKRVTWGRQTTDEMLVGYVGVVKKGQDLTVAGAKDDLFDILMDQHIKKALRAMDARLRRNYDRRAGSVAP
jgi:hypothetical protein